MSFSLNSHSPQYVSFYYAFAASKPSASLYENKHSINIKITVCKSQKILRRLYYCKTFKHVYFRGTVIHHNKAKHKRQHVLTL